MELKAPKNPNYSAVVTRLETFVPLAGCDNVHAALIFGNQVIVGKDTPVGALGLFFPVETQLHSSLLSANNLYRKAEWGNVDPEKKGFFEQHGRVKAIRFRGHKSEGFWIPLDSLSYTGVPLSEFEVGQTFDAIGDQEICRKYAPKRNPGRMGSRQARQARLEDQIVEGQFRFHPDTEQLRRNVHKVQPTDWISISDKWHGTSVVLSNILVNRPLKWYERLINFAGIPIQKQQYGLVYSSRRVIKAVNGEAKNSQHYYSSDVWGDVAKEVQDRIPKGYTLYGEIVGFTSDGSPIQKGYHYGCQPSTHRFLVYRVTNTNADGRVLELSWLQMKAFCEFYGLEMVKEIWYGRAKDLFPKLDTFDVSEWQQNFLRRLEEAYVKDDMCPYNNGEVPAEGIVLRVDRLDSADAFKLKNYKFLEWETKQLDKGTVDMESEQGEVEIEYQEEQTVSEDLL